MAGTVNTGETRHAERAQGRATILAISTANPSNCVYQADYPDYYFKITKSEHMVELKEKFKRICDKSMIRKRHMHHLTEDFLEKNPNVSDFHGTSLNVRQELLVVEDPKLGKEAATKAIKEWGQPTSNITHLIFSTTSGADIPGADYQLVKLLGLDHSVQRFMLSNQGCNSGGTILRLAKDLAENNKGARVLVVCTYLSAVTFRGPHAEHVDFLVGQATFGDGAAALIVGSDPDFSKEVPLFQMVSAFQTILPESNGVVEGRLRESGLVYTLLKTVPRLIADNIENALTKALSPLGITDWNSIFWIVHPGGRAILDQMELKLGLKEEKMRATRHVLRQYGNMSGATCLFVMDEMRKNSMKAGAATTGEGSDWGILFAFGPGLTVETILLHSLPNTAQMSIA